MSDSRGRAMRDPLVWFFLLTVIVSLLGVIDMACEIGSPFGGYVSYRRAAIATGEVDINTPVWWEGVIQGRLTYDATLLTAGGLPYYPNVRSAFAQAAAEGRRFVTLTYLLPGGDRPISLDMPVERFDLAHFFDVRLPDLIMAVTFWLLALIVYFSDPRDPSNRAFALASAFVGMLRAIYVHNLFLDDFLATLVETILLVAIPMLGVALLNFAANFPVPGGPRWRRLIALALIVAIVSSICAVLARLPVFPPAANRLFADINYYLTVTLYLVGLASLTGRLIRRLALRHHLSRRERRVLAIVIGGLFLAMPMLLISAFTWITIDGRQLTYFIRGLDLRYLLLAVPLTFAYALVRYRSLRAPSLLFVFVIVLSFSAIVAALGAWVWTWGHPLWPENGLRPPFILLFLAAFASSMLWGGAASARGTFGRIFHYDRRAYSAARNFGRHITGRSDLKTLPTTVTEALVEEFELERAAIWLKQDGGGALALAGQHGSFLTPPPPSLPAVFVPGRPNIRPLTGAPIHIDRPESAPDWLWPIAGGGTFEVALPLLADGALMGLIALGPRWDEGIFDSRALETAELIGQQATLFLTATAGISELRRVPGRMADVQDRERRRLAQELHDTIQQFLGRLPFYLSVSRDAIQTQPVLAHDILDRAITEVEEAAIVVRQIRHDLAPSQLERGLAAAVTVLGRQFEQRSGIKVSVEIDTHVDGLTSTEIRYAVYRVIQQALDNVEAHAQASTVAIELFVAENDIIFSVRDDGCGSTEAQRRAAQEQGSYGLESMRARLEGHGGEFHLSSAAGQGTVIRGRVPASPTALNQDV